MYNFGIRFDRPWFLLLLIPAAGLMLFHFFRVEKKFRLIRNRVVSMVFHSLIVVLCVSLLSGMRFTYNKYNSNNEILLVVDTSFSTASEQQAKDDYVRDVIAMGNAKVYKIGVVTFGFDQIYAVPFTDDLDSVWEKYKAAQTPNTSATDIAAALQFAKEKFTHPESGKIVLLSDGAETDERASTVIRAICAEGIAVDVVECSPIDAQNEIQLVSAALPDSAVALGETFEIQLSVYNKMRETQSVTVNAYDNGTACGTVTGEVAPGLQTLTLSHAFDKDDLHALKFELQCETDEIAENNVIYTYKYLEVFDDILILEYYDNDSQALAQLLSEKYNVTIMNVQSEGVMPRTIDELRKYDQVIVNNVADEEFPDGFIDLLHEYVYELGGGLFTVGGGTPGDPETAHAYSHERFIGKYRQMLPVQAIDYTPPLGLMMVIDVSGSMGDKLKAAKDTARSLLYDDSCLTERDYCGLVALGDSYLQLTEGLKPMTEQYELESALNSIESIDDGNLSGGTQFYPSINYANGVLTAANRSGLVEKMHVIVITDGAAFDPERYVEEVKNGYSKGVTYTFIAVEASGSDYDEMVKAVAGENGQSYGKVYNVNQSELTQKVKDDVRVDEIKDVVYESFTPKVNPASYFAKVLADGKMPALNGFYGAKARAGKDVETALTGEYGVPVYAQWRYGAGQVGSFMCDLNRIWSNDFFESEEGRKLIFAMVEKLFPASSIKAHDLRVSAKEENFITQLSVYTERDLSEGESVRVSVVNESNPDAVADVTPPGTADGFSRASFVATDAGVYRITVTRLNADESVADEITLYKTLSYSSEYDVYAAREKMYLMQALADVSGGNCASLYSADPYKVFEGFEIGFARSFDPRFLFMILTIVLLLADVAVRKFKFKWIHEIIRDRKLKKESQKERV